MNGLRAAKYVVKAASFILSILILLIIAGPIAGAVSPQYMTQQQPLGIGVDLNSIQSQLSFFNSSSTIVGAHDIAVTAFNNWPLPGAANLSLTIIANGQILYRTQSVSVELAPFQSGRLHITMDVPSTLVSQLQGQQHIGIGGTLTLSERQFLTITVSFPQ